MTTADDEDVVIDLTLRDYLSVSAGTAAREMDELASNARKASRSLLLFDKRADKATRTIDKMTAALVRYNMASKGFNNNIDAGTAQLDRYTKSGDRVTRSLKRNESQTKKADKANKLFTKSLKGLVAFGVMAKTAMLGLGLAFAVVGGAAAGGVALQAILQISAALVPLISLAAMLPIAIGGIVAAAMTLKVAFKGVGDTISAALSGDMGKFEESLKNLSPAARAFFKEFKPFIKQIKAMKSVIQDALFKPLIGTLEPFLARTLPMIRSGMALVASQLSKLVGNFMTFFRTDTGREMLLNFFKAAAMLIGNISKVLSPLMTGLSAVIKTSLPYWERFSKAIGENMGQFGDWMKEISESGQLGEWLDIAIKTTGELWGILKNVGSILGNILEAAGGMGSFAGIEGLLETFNEWSASAEGQDAISSFFESLHTVLKALSPLVSIFGNAIGHLAPAIAAIVEGLAPGFIIFLQALSDGIAVLGPYWGPLAEALGSLLTALAPLLPVLGQLVGLIGGYLAVALKLLAPIIGVLANAIAAVLGPVLESAGVILQAIIPYVDEFAAIFTGALQMLVPMLQTFGQIFAENFQTHFQKMMELLPQLMPMLIELAMIFVTDLMKSLEQLMPYMPMLIEALFQVMAAMIPLLPQILRLAILFLSSTDKLTPFIPMILSLVIALLKLQAGTIQVATAILTFVNDTIENIKKLWDAVNTKMTDIKDSIKDAFDDAWAKVDEIIGKIQRAIDNVSFASLKEQVGGVLSGLNPFRFAGGDVMAGQKYTVGEIGPEMYVSSSGTTEMIGTGGMETRSFGSDGYIIPSFMLDAMDKLKSSMDKELAQVSASANGGLSTRDAEALVAAGARAAREGGGNTYAVNVNINGNVDSEVDIERAVKKAIAKIEKDKKERGTK